ncbi:FHA domain-containing protein [uncultured Helcococcus sp.]|uniref:FHA domain-containing protein n=1 Tax=uncultured Helcococcus sp. TaxID=1072508 RepID=UPI0026391767|nr:FHA domain-containing protein [uncultured Helcococcus sp.]
MRELLNIVRNAFFTNIIGNLNLYTIISSIVKFILVYIVLYYIYIIVKLIILDIRNIDFDKVKRDYYLIVRDQNGSSKSYLLEGYTSIGRNLGNDIVLDSDLVSSYHAEIIKSEDSFYLVDKGSLNGTYLNGEYLDTNLELLVGDEIEIGPYVLNLNVEIS